MTQNLNPITPDKMKAKIQKAGRPVWFTNGNGFDYKMSVGFNPKDLYLILVTKTDFVNFNPFIWGESAHSLSITLDDKQSDESKQDLPIAKPSKSFDPDNLIFDGVKIKEGDTVVFGNNWGMTQTSLVFEYGQNLAAGFRDKLIPLQMLNIIRHNRSQKSELKEALEVLETARENMLDAFTAPSLTREELQKYIDDYYQARKRVEELKTQN